MTLEWVDLHAHTRANGVIYSSWHPRASTETPSPQGRIAPLRSEEGSKPKRPRTRSARPTKASRVRCEVGSTRRTARIALPLVPRIRNMATTAGARVGSWSWAHRDCAARGAATCSGRGPLASTSEFARDGRWTIAPSMGRAGRASGWRFLSATVGRVRAAACIPSPSTSWSSTI